MRRVVDARVVPAAKVESTSQNLLAEIEYLRAQLAKVTRALVDLLDGVTSSYDIHQETGLPQARCQEIIDLRNELSDHVTIE